jgi:hypothetical protein
MASASLRFRDRVPLDPRSLTLYDEKEGDFVSPLEGPGNIIPLALMQQSLSIAS